LSTLIYATIVRMLKDTPKKSLILVFE